MNIYLATDHAGFAHKNSVRDWLMQEGYEVVDCGAKHHDPEDDYTDFIARAAQAVSENPENARAVIFGGSGQGEAILANRYPQVRAAVFYGGSHEIIRLSREHNDANALSIGARFVSLEETKAAVWEWLHTKKSPETKYARRIKAAARVARELK